MSMYVSKIEFDFFHLTLNFFLFYLLSYFHNEKNILLVHSN